MNSLILKVAARFLMSLILLYATFLFLKGHHSPGGGFLGGLVAAIAWTLYSVSYGTKAATVGLGISLISVVAAGLLVIIFSGLVAVIEARPFLTGHWYEVYFSRDYQMQIGTPIAFDFGIFLIVFATALKIVFALQEEA